MSRAVLSLLLVLASCVALHGPAPDRPPMGRLGRPIGTFVRLEGVREEHGKVASSTLRVDRVDGVALAAPVDVTLEAFELPAGERCALSGYETGRWIGLPPEVQRAEQLPPHQALWQLSCSFVVTSVQAPASLVGRRPAARSPR